MAHDMAADGWYHCFFRKQPATLQERQRAVRAVWVGCCGTVRYGGTDRQILQSLKEHGAETACDFPMQSQ
jgi:hypothetical protein